MSRALATPLIQCIEYDWSLVARCPVCGHTASWGAVDMAEKFRDQLRICWGEIGRKIAPHCGRPPVVYLKQGAGMMAWNGPDLQKSISDPFAYRDRRLRAFLAQQKLPMSLADERKAAADAFCADPGGY